MSCGLRVMVVVIGDNLVYMLLAVDLQVSVDRPLQKASVRAALPPGDGFDAFDIAGWHAHRKCDQLFRLFMLIRQFRRIRLIGLFRLTWLICTTWRC